MITDRNIIPSISAVNLGNGRFQITEPLFYSMALDRWLTALHGEDWTTDAKDTSGAVQLWVTVDSHRKALIDAGEAPVLVGMGHGLAVVTVAAKTALAPAELVDRVHTLLPRPTPSTTQEVPVTFMGAEFMTRRALVVPTWDKIQGNYPTAVSDGVAALIERASSQPGRLLLWHGLPGAGKTFALRALAWEWREWCDLHYIVDPESFVGPRTEYMTGSLLSAMSDEEAPNGQPKWRLLVAEDTGELLAKDAKTQVSQGLSRLLNMVDGLIGQGLRTMVLITTNEKLEGMHEAVIRPGRTGSVIEFLPFTPDEANEWLLRNRKPCLDDRKPRTLAELFAGARPQKSSIGFVPDGLRKTA